MTIGGNTGQIQRLRNFSEIPLTFNHTRSDRIQARATHSELRVFLERQFGKK